MDSFTGLSGFISCPDAMGISVRRVHADVSDPATTDVNITLSGSFGTYHEFSALTPVDVDLVFKRDEYISVVSEGTSLKGVIINYIKRGSQEIYQTTSPAKVHRHMPHKWHN